MTTSPLTEQAPKNLWILVLTVLLSVSGGAAAPWLAGPHKSCVSKAEMDLAISKAESRAAQRASEAVGVQLEHQAQILARIESKVDQLDERLRAVEQRPPRR